MIMKIMIFIMTMTIFIIKIIMTTTMSLLLLTKTGRQAGRQHLLIITRHEWNLWKTNTINNTTTTVKQKKKFFFSKSHNTTQRTWHPVVSDERVMREIVREREGERIRVHVKSVFRKCGRNMLGNNIYKWLADKYSF